MRIYCIYIYTCYICVYVYCIPYARIYGFLHTQHACRTVCGKNIRFYNNQVAVSKMTFKHFNFEKGADILGDEDMYKQMVKRYASEFEVG